MKKKYFVFEHFLVYLKVSKFKSGRIKLELYDVLDNPITTLSCDIEDRPIDEVLIDDFTSDLVLQQWCIDKNIFNKVSSFQDVRINVAIGSLIDEQYHKQDFEFTKEEALKYYKKTIPQVL